MSELDLNLQQVWARALSERQGQSFLNISLSGNSKSSSYQFSTFFKRAERVAVALRNEVGLAEGDRVLLLTRNENQLALLAHGLWLAGLCAVSVDCEPGTDQLSKVCNALEIKAMVFDPEQTAQLSLLAGQVSVKHWLVWGESQAQTGAAVLHLDELMKLSAGTDISELQLSNLDPDGLVFVDQQSQADVRFLIFPQSELLAAARRFASFFVGVQASQESAWTSLSLRTPQGLCCNLLSPFFSGVPMLISQLDDFRLFWDQMVASEVSHALISQSQLRIASRKTQSSEISKGRLRVSAYTDERLSYELFEQIEATFGTRLFPMYLKTECAGPACGFQPDEFESKGSFWSMDFSLPSSGPRLADLDLRVVDSDGLPVGPEVIGEIRIRCKSRILGSRLETLCDLNDWISTGNEGFYVLDSQGRDFLFVTGLFKRFIRRGNQLINPSIAENALFDTKGVSDCRVFGFPNLSVGTEIGAWVKPMAAAQELSEARLLKRLQRRLDWAECPKVILLGKKGAAHQCPTENELEDLTHQYYSVDYQSRQG